MQAELPACSCAGPPACPPPNPALPRSLRAWKGELAATVASQRRRKYEPPDGSLSYF